MLSSLAATSLPRLLMILLTVAPPTPLVARRASDADRGANEQPELVVRLVDGRDLRGRLDDHTDQRHLWLRVETASTLVLRPLPWHRVAEIQDEHRTTVRRTAGAAAATYAERAAWALADADDVTSVRFLVERIPANDASGGDSLSVRVRMRDSRFRPVAPDGVLEATLVPLDERFSPRGAKPLRWTIAADRASFDGSGPRVRLDLEGLPERRRGSGVLKLRWVVDGHRAFEGEVDLAQIR